MIFVLLLTLATLNAVIGIPEHKRVNPEETGTYFESDIRPKYQNELTGVMHYEKYWPNGMVAYRFAKGFDKQKKSVVRKAMKHIESVCNTIKFEKMTTEKDYVEFIDTESSCWSHIGQIGGKQQVSYTQQCIDSFGSVLHELFHTLGFWHEHSRWNRDEYVKIKMNNLKQLGDKSFHIYAGDWVTAKGIPYDYGSVMHFSAFALSRNGRQTIVPKDPNAVIGQREGLGKNDIRKLKKFYKC